MRLTMQFCGGPLNGEKYDADSSHDESALPVLLFRMSDYGTIGKQFVFIPPADLEVIEEFGFDGAIEKGHRSWPVCYEVASQLRRDDGITVAANYVHPEGAHEHRHGRLSGSS